MRLVNESDLLKEEIERSKRLLTEIENTFGRLKTVLNDVFYTASPTKDGSGVYASC